MADNPRIKAGDRVVGEINVKKPNCDCDACQEGGVRQRNHCQNRTVLGIINKDGTFAQYLTLPVDNLFPVPSSVSDERATFAEPLAAAFRIVEQNFIKCSDRVAIVGDGKLGLLIAMVMKCQQIQSLTIFGKHADKMAVLPVSGDWGIVTDHECIVVDDKTDEKYADAFDVCIEASGTPNGVMMAMSMTRPLGTLALKTTCAMGANAFNTAPFVVKELNIVGSRCGNFEMALQGLENGLPVERLLTATYSLSDALDAIEHTRQKGTLKIQLLM